MRILYIVPELYKHGGIQEFAKSIYSELKNDFNIELINWQNDLSLLAKGILKFSPSKFSQSLYLKFFSSHFRKKYDLNADLIHFWHPEPAMAFLDRKYIVSCHGMEILEENTKGYRKLIYKKVFDNALVIHANSRYTKDLVINLFEVDPDKVVVINPPIDVKKFNSRGRKKKEIFIIGTLTRFNRRKNIPNIIKALNILKEKYGVKFKYLLAGDGIDRKRIMNELKRAKFEYEYLGEISEEEKINEFYPSIDVFVLPPLELPNDVEGFGIVYLEANACGIPVVASKTGGVPDAVEEGVSGVFADPTNPEDIATKILEVLKNKEKYFKSAKNWAERFDVKKVKKEFIKMYEVNYENVGKRR
ncbi:glycosyltransferase family 4 protein [Methanophagales archaeon]|nr:MAG: glycosyltransferase family 4 protein [Methanophagales archaeon]